MGEDCDGEEGGHFVVFVRGVWGWAEGWEVGFGGGDGVFIYTVVKLCKF